MPKESEKHQVKEEVKAKPKKNNSLKIILALLMVLAASTAGWYFLFREDPSQYIPAKQVVDETDEVGEGEGLPIRTMNLAGIKTETLDLGNVVVNLAGNGSQSYIRLNIILEYPQANKNLTKELSENQHLIRDVLIAHLRSKTHSEVSAADASETLKKDLLRVINRNLQSGDVGEIFFTEFLVQ